MNQMVYFDNAATTFPKPGRVVDSVNEGILRFGGNPGRSGHRMSMRAAQKVYDVREKAALLFGTDVECVIFTNNCTSALNMAIKGLVAGQDRPHIVTSCLEHNSVIRPIYKLAITQGASYSVAQVFPGDDARTLASFRSCITPYTKLVVCTYASNVTGYVLPVSQIGQFCRSRGIPFVVDCAQAAGVLPCKIDELNADVLCIAGHKSLYGITGTGLMILRPGISPDTIMEGGTGSASIQLEQPQEAPDKFESGTLNTVGICSLGAGMDFIRQIGMRRIHEKECGLCRRLCDQLKHVDGVKLYSGWFDMGRNAPVVSFNIDGMASEEVTGILDRNGYALRGGR